VAEKRGWLALIVVISEDVMCAFCGLEEIGAEKG